MRIQHNIMAMSAYRNYTNNVSAMKKNLEKLSSGYKINRAGDDAAGLAISEKMRAQITGLETAQKNAKDGISLVQTAEGALTEVHDMLNRMVELATMSANGTYDNATDRAQLQKEMDQLRSEIDRIADSSNFNGINLLDGSMQATKTLSNDEILNLIPALAGDQNEAGVISGGTIVEGSGGEAQPASFEISLEGVSGIAATAGDVFKLTIGDTTVTAALTDGTTYGAKELAAAIQGANTTVTVGGNAFKVTVEDDLLKFEATTNDEIHLDTQAKVEWAVTNAAGEDTYVDDGIQPFDMGPIVYTDNSPSIEGNAGTNIEFKAAVGGTAAVYTANLNGKGQADLDGKKIDGVALAWASTAGTSFTLTSAMNNFVSAYNATSGKAYTASVSGNSIVLTAKSKGAVTTAPSTDVASVTMAVSVTGAAPSSAAITINAGGLSKTDILAAVPSGTANNAKVTIALNSANKLDLKIGDQVIGTSVSAVAGTATTFTFNVAGGTASLGSITFSATPSAADFTAAIETGLTYSTGETPPPTPSADVSFTGITGVNFASADVALTSGAMDKLQAALSTKGEVSISNVSTGAVTVDFSQITVASGDTLTDVADKIKALAVSAFNAWNTANPSSDYVFTGVEIATDADFTNIISSVSGTAPLAGNTPDGLYVRALVGPRPDNGGTENVKSHGVINRGIQNPVDSAGIPNDNLANTVVKFGDANAWQDGAQITIGNEVYTVAIGKDSNYKNANNVVDLTAFEAKDLTAKQAAQALAVAANGNKIFSVGHDGNGGTTLQQRLSVKDDTDMSSREKIAEYLGVKTANMVDGKAGKGLTLQIGDTADNYNKLTVDIQDMHTKALGLDKISIADQDAASDAIEAIKDAINQVSDVRGTLGATQNRLDHTINNLSVMTENIQDAESTIRDVDVAEEMMAYTKNNILIQSAQAMLAQANQVPQGVLQLLQ